MRKFEKIKQKRHKYKGNTKTKSLTFLNTKGINKIKENIIMEIKAQKYDVICILMQNNISTHLLKDKNVTFQFVLNSKTYLNDD